MLAASFANKLYFHLVKNMFSLETSSLTIVVFRDVLYDLQLFGSFSVISLLTDFSLISLRSESRDDRSPGEGVSRPWPWSVFVHVL